MRAASANRSLKSRFRKSKNAADSSRIWRGLGKLPGPGKRDASIERPCALKASRDLRTCAWDSGVSDFLPASSIRRTYTAQGRLVDNF